MTTAPLDVLQVVTADQRRGAETYALELGAALAERCRHVTTVALTAGTGPGLGVEVLGVGARSPSTLRALRHRAAESDVVVAHGSSTLAACALATFGGPPVVYRVIGDPMVWAPGGWRKALVGSLLRRTAAVAVYFPAAAEALVAHHGLAPAHVHVLAKGIDVAAWPAIDDGRRAAARQALSLPSSGGGPVLAWLGALSPEKRPDLALDMVAALPEATLLLAGTGPSAEAVAERATGLGDRVRVLGAVADPRPVLAAADALVLTSRTEGVPGVVLEAQASGLAVVAVDVGGVSQIVVDGATGRLVPPGASGPAGGLAAELAEATRWVLDRGPALGAAGRAHVAEHLAIADVADRWVALLSAVADR